MLTLQIPDMGVRMCITQNVSNGTDVFPSTQAKMTGLDAVGCRKVALGSHRKMVLFLRALGG